MRIRKSLLAIVAVATIAGSLGLSPAAQAAPTSDNRAPVAPVAQTSDNAGVASFKGKQIDLADGWQGAQTCAVFSRTETRCYATQAEADKAVGYSRATDALYQEQLRKAGSDAKLLAVPACANGWLCLYEHINGGGRRLIFSDEYWMQLADYGFNQQTSSWRNNQGSSDQGHLSLYNLSSVYNCSANAYASQMGSYNDQAYAVWG